jgi:hypothetical protein
MKAFGPFLGLVISLYLCWGYNKAGFNVNSSFNVTIFGPLNKFLRAYSLKHEHEHVQISWVVLSLDPNCFVYNGSH